MKRTIKIMTNEERLNYLWEPLIMSGMCLALGVVATISAVKDNQPNFAYLMWGVAVFLFIYGITDWWSAFKAWKEGRADRNGVEEKKDEVVEKNK